MDLRALKVDLRTLQVDLRTLQVDLRFSEVDLRTLKVDLGFSEVDLRTSKVGLRTSEVGLRISQAGRHTYRLDTQLAGRLGQFSFVDGDAVAVGVEVEVHGRLLLDRGGAVVPVEQDQYFSNSPSITRAGVVKPQHTQHPCPNNVIDLA